MSVAVTADDPSTFAVEVMASDVPVIVDFWAPWCGPCRMVSPELDKIALEKGGSVKLVKVDVDKNTEIARQYQVFSIPSIGLFVDGKLAEMTVGAKPAKAIEEGLKLSIHLKTPTK